MDKPLLLVDIDGVISLFGAAGAAAAVTIATSAPARVDAGTPERPAVEGFFHAIEGIPHYLSSTAAAQLRSLAGDFELVWASGWEEKANDHLPHLLELPAALPFIPFSRGASVGERSTHAHWKLESIASFAGERPLAWVDDALDRECHSWAAARSAPTLLVATAPDRGLTEAETLMLRRWAQALRQRA